MYASAPLRKMHEVPSLSALFPFTETETYLENTFIHGVLHLITVPECAVKIKIHFLGVKKSRYCDQADRMSPGNIRG